jgi:hypothetical protein
MVFGDDLSDGGSHISDASDLSDIKISFGA